MVTPGFQLLYASASSIITGPTEVEPLTDRFPVMPEGVYSPGILLYSDVFFTHDGLAFGAQDKLYKVSPQIRETIFPVADVEGTGHHIGSRLSHVLP